MARISKAPEERRQEIIDTAQRLFAERGFANCSVDLIIREMGVAKGTFYYYFRTKEDVLSAIADKTLDGILDMANAVADTPGLSAMDKMAALLGDTHIGDEDTAAVADMLHLPGNRELHELTNVRTVLRLSPILARIVEQGVAEGVFHTTRPLETVQFLLTGAQFLLDGGLFDFSPEEVRARRAVVQSAIEQGLGAEPGSFHFMNPIREAST